MIFELQTVFLSLLGDTTGRLVVGLEVKSDFLGDVKREASCNMMLFLLTRSDAFTKPLVCGSLSFKGDDLVESASKLEYRRCVLVY